MEKDYLNKSLEEIEDDVWPATDYPSNLVKKIHELRKKKLKDYTVEDLRISIGQNSGLPYLIPIAIEKLNEDILISGDYYPGDLLNNVLSSDKKFWQKNILLWKRISEIYNRNKILLNSENEYKEIRKSFEAFELIHE